MDSFAVSLTSGVLLKPFKWSRVLKIAAFMALFQGGMPLIGWALGIGFKSYIEAYDHWVAFGVLLFLGAKMIWEGWPRKNEEEPCCMDPSDTRTLVGLSLATSIDALAVGVTLQMAAISPEGLFPPIGWSVLIIGAVTFSLSLIAVYLGKLIGDRLADKAQLLGGIVLIAIGVKLLLEGIL